MGATTPDDVEVMIRPHLFSRIFGSTASLIAITESTMLSKYFRQLFGALAGNERRRRSTGDIDEDVHRSKLLFDQGQVRLYYREIAEIPRKEPWQSRRLPECPPPSFRQLPY